LGTTAIVWPADALGDPGEVGVQFGSGIGLVEVGDAVPVVPEVLVFSGKECGDEVILGSEVAIEAGFGNPGLFDYEVNTDGAYASFVKKLRGGAENTVSDLGGACVGFGNGRAFRICRHLELS